jgi:hypothetical protein
MPSFFNFQQGSESRGGPATESSPLLGRFRAVPDAQRIGRRNSHRNSLLGSFTAGRGFGYAGVFGNRDDSDEGDLLDNEDMGALRRWGRTQRSVKLSPQVLLLDKVVRSELMSKEPVCLGPWTGLRAPELLEYSTKITY